jgi:hypothetical protein
MNKQNILGADPKKSVLLASAIALATTSIAVMAQEAGGSSIASAAGDAAVVQSLAAAMANETSVMPESTTAEDYEAALMFVVSQQEYPVETAEQALNILEGNSAGNPALLLAIGRVRDALRKRNFKRGTAALAGGNNGGFGSSNFSFPSIGSGGGTSNYGQ